VDLDLEAIIVKGCILILACLSAIRLILHDFNNLKNDWKRHRK